MKKHQGLQKVSVDVVRKGKQYFASVGWHQSRHLLGPAESRDEIYQQVYGYISDLRLVAELYQTQLYGALRAKRRP